MIDRHGGQAGKGTALLAHAALSHEGRVRAANEDAFGVRAEDGVFVVADGMGGHDRGEWAAAAIVEAIAAVALPIGFDAGVAALHAAIQRANARIHREAGAAGAQAGSTVVVLFVRGPRVAVLWVGDSRAYRVRDGAATRLSHDHTQVQAMLDRGLLTAAEAASHPMGHVLARAVGAEPTVDVDIVGDALRPGDAFLLCSDGLTARVADDEIAAALAGAEPAEAVRRLVDATLRRGAPDNVTVVAVRVEGAAVGAARLAAVAS